MNCQNSKGIFLWMFFVFLYLLPAFGCKNKSQDEIDLVFIQNAIVENHPGMFNTLDPDFRENLSKAFERAKLQIQSGAGKRALSKFVESFSDGHLGICWYEKAVTSPKKVGSKRFSIDSADGICWVRLPTFQLNANQELQFKQILKNLDEAVVLQNEAIVFDIRGNGGGNSWYGREIVRTIFGKKYTEQIVAQANKQVYVEWRASVDNIRYLESCSCSGMELDRIINGMRASLRMLQPFYKEQDEVFYDQSETDILSTKAPYIFVIIDSRNASAALDFIDDLKVLAKDITLIGQQTGADRLYMEIRDIELPSKRGNFYFPIKVYRNRLRKDQQPYSPDIVVDPADINAEILDEEEDCFAKIVLFREGYASKIYSKARLYEDKSLWEKAAVSFLIAAYLFVMSRELLTASTCYANAACNFKKAGLFDKALKAEESSNKYLSMVVSEK